jgi:hypothetical protein
MQTDYKLVEATVNGQTARYYIHKDDTPCPAHAKEILEEHGAEGILLSEIQIRIVEQTLLTEG